MKKNLLAFTFYILAFPAFSQQDSLLKNFKYRIDTYRAINMKFDGSSQYNKAEPPIGARENSTSSGGIGVGYYSVQSSEKILSTRSAGFSSSFLFSKGTSPGDKSRSRVFSIIPNLRVLNKWFSKNNFIELGGDGSADFRSNKNMVTAGKNSQGQYTMQLNTGIGKGRLENVTDMQNAIWLSKALEAENSLNAPLSSVQLNELGRTITRANNTRVLDSRRRTRFILATVDGYLQQQGLINKTDINYFSNLNDILFFCI